MVIKEIRDKIIWGNFLKNSGENAFFQSYDWGEVVSGAGRPVNRVGVYDKERLVAVASIERVQAKRGTFLHVRNGPVFAKDNIRKPFKVLTEYLRNKAGKEKAWFARISPLLFPQTGISEYLKLYGYIPSPIHAMDGEYVRVLDISGSLQDIMSGMRKTTRYLVKQSQSSGIKIIREEDPKANLEDFFHLYRQTAIRQKFVMHHDIQAEYRLFARQGKGFLYKGYSQGRLVSAAFIVYSFHQAIYRHSASLPVKDPVNYALQWQIIKDAKEKNLKEYNLWGIASQEKDKHPWKGLTLFKTGFGGKTFEYVHAHDIPFSPFYYLSWSVETLRRIRKGY